MSDAPFRLDVDVSCWPLVVVTHEGQPDDQALREHLAEIEQRVLARAQPCVQVVDHSRAELPSALQRRLIAEHLDAAYRRWCRGEAYVNPAPEIRGAMRAVFWVATPSYPYAFVETLAAALDWARERLAQPHTGR
jgi:hypothetical protein